METRRDEARKKDRVEALALRAGSFAMGFVFFTGAWRRFVNVPAKLDIDSSKDVLGKLVEAAPGSPIEGAIHYILDRPALAEAISYLMTVAEFTVGLALMLGLFTRISAAGAALLNVVLMLIFGWEGYECLDEWTMSALGFAISIGIMIYGPSAYSIDTALDWDPLARLMTRPVALTLTWSAIFFTALFYIYYFGLLHLERRTDIGLYRIVAEKTDSPGTAILYVDAGGSAGGAMMRSIAYRLEDGSEITQRADEIEVVKSYYEPWSQSGGVTDGFMRLRLGSKTEIRVPDGAVSARVNLLDNPDQDIELR